MTIEELKKTTKEIEDILHERIRKIEKENDVSIHTLMYRRGKSKSNQFADITFDDRYDEQSYINVVFNI